MFTITISLTVVLGVQSVNRARKKGYNNLKRRNEMITIHRPIIVYLGNIKSLHLELMTEVSKVSDMCPIYKNCVNSSYKTTRK